MDNKKLYTEFCSTIIDLPIFFNPWWLDSVCMDGSWDALIFEKNGQIRGIFPYYKKKKIGIFNLITMPPFTLALGPYLIYPAGLLNYEIASFEKEAYNYFIDSLPGFGRFSQFFNYRFKNWLPFYWKNFSQTTYYSSVIDDIRNIEKVKSGFHSNKVQEIRKAGSVVNVKFDLSPHEFYDFHKASLAKKNDEISYSFELFARIYNESRDKEAGRIIYAADDKKIYSALFFVWDKNSGYNLITVSDPDTRKTGALSLLVYEAIKFLGNKTSSYDLEGSMNENYEFSYRQFGGAQKPYFYITKTNSLFIRLAEMAKYRI